MGIRGNLCSGEILEQVVHASRILASDSDGNNSKQNGKQTKHLDLIRNIVFMGMGEPLNNYANVLTTCKALIDRRLWNLSHNRVTVSTVGVTSRMRDLTRDLPEVNLALSLHAPNQEMREAIVPAAKGTPIESLIEALDEHMMAFARRNLLLENPQESSSDSTDRQGGGQYNNDERVTASKKKRAMIEYVMRK
jgi:sorting nexin-8